MEKMNYISKIVMVTIFKAYLYGPIICLHQIKISLNK